MFLVPRTIHNLNRFFTDKLGLTLFLLCIPLLPVVANGEESQGLPPGKGREQVIENCTVCHSSAIILQNHMARKQWDETLTWMQEKQGLWDLELDLRKTILDYLATYQGIKKTPSQSSDPMGHKYTYRPNPL